MLVDVIYVRQGSTEPLRTRRHLLAWREGEHDHIQTDRWKEGAVDIARLAHTGEHSPIEIFLCPRDNHLMNRDFLRRLVASAQMYGWGASVHVVVDSKWDPLSNLIEWSFEDHRESLNYWFDAMHDAAATDILQLSLNQPERNRIWEYTDCLHKLRSGADSSARRQRALLPESDWKGLVRKEDRVLRQFLDSFEVYSDSSVPTSITGNLITILEESSPNGQKRLVEKALAVAKGKHLVAIRHPFAPSDYINALKDRGKLRIVSYRGSFELRYLFHLLNQGDPQDSISEVGRVTYVKVRKPSLFQPYEKQQSASLLVTSSFHHDDEDQCLEAALEVGHATNRKPSSTEYLAHLAIDCDRLAEVANSLSLHQTAWLHVGHGKKAFGLQEATGGAEPGKRWLQSFAPHGTRGGSLALAVFSACETAEVARKFAEAGVGVAIGFEKRVPSNACKFLTAEIVGAALRSKGDQDSILRAFHLGCARLKAHHRKPGPVAYCAERK